METDALPSVETVPPTTRDDYSVAIWDLDSETVREIQGGSFLELNHLTNPAALDAYRCWCGLPTAEKDMIRSASAN